MRTVDLRRYAVLERVRDFGESHRDGFPESSVAGHAFAAVAAAVEKLRDSMLKASAEHRGSQGRARARASLADRLGAIGRTARAIANTTPGFDDPFRRPHRRQRDRVLIIAGRVALDHAEPSRSLFIAYGLREGFVGELRALLDEFERAVHSHSAVYGRQAATRKSAETAFTSGFAAVRQLDVIVANAFRRDSVAMAGWRGVRRVGHPRRARRLDAA